MPSYTTADIRNIVLLGHAGTGKTSLTEALLKAAGAIHHLGLVEKGTTVSDWTDEEKTHGHSISASIMHCDFQGKHINLIDTPGYADFTGQSVQALNAVETAAIVISAASGATIESGARKMMERATAQHLCRMIVINKIDHENADLPALVKNIRETFGKECLPVNLPAQNRTAAVDCFFTREGQSDLGSVAAAHQQIVEQVVEVDEKLMAHYLEHGEIEMEKMHDAFEKALRQGHLVPILFTSARTHANPEKSVGIAELLSFLVQLGPSPLEANGHSFVIKGHGEIQPSITPNPAGHIVAHCFSITIDPFVGKLCAFRVHQGTVKQHANLFVSDVRQGEVKKPIKLAHIFKYQGKEHVEISEAIPGDIAAVAKIDEIHHDAVLHDHHEEDGIHVEETPFPRPMFGLAIIPKSRGDEQKIAETLARVVEEDPTFKIVRDSSTHETIIYGLGELHLRVILEKLKARYKIDMDTKPPKIAYRESISSRADGHHRHKKQSGGAGQFGEVYLRILPLARGTGFEFVDDTFGGNPPKQYLPAIEKGVRQVLETGAVAGYPMQDVRVEVYDGKHHDVDSKEVAFITAGRRAFIDAVQKARPTLLEPCVVIDVTVPNQYMGNITGDLIGKRGRIQGTDMFAGDICSIKAVVPLSEVANYQNQLKSVTGGQGSYTMEFSHYDPVPPQVQQQIVAAYKPRAEEE